MKRVIWGCSAENYIGYVAQIFRLKSVINAEKHFLIENHVDINCWK